MAGRQPVSLGVRCERARHWASLRVDGELSSLEDQLLERHLASCEACEAFDAGLGAATSLLRDAPPETPGRRFSPPRRRAGRFPLEVRRTALIATAALAFGALTGSLVQRPSSSAPADDVREVSMISRDVKQLRQLPRMKRATIPAPVPSGPPNPPEGVI
jgi:anti-sigma factor RsiW